MGGCASKSEEQAASERIDREMKASRRAFSNDVKLLLLGAGESGKSTIFKQMKIIHQNGYSDNERANFKSIVNMNTIQSMKALIRGAEKLHIAVKREDLAGKVLELSISSTITPETGNTIATLWQDPGIQAAYGRSAEFQLNDSSAYYFDAIDRIAQADYVPSVDDVLRSRVKTTGIVEMEFSYNRIHFRMFDVGGQRNERRKWIHHFDGVTAVIFVTSLSEYDQTLYEDESTNRMKESLLLFDEICNNKWFVQTSIILFLNKMDLFETKIQNVDLSVCFPDYDGGCNYQAALNFIKKKFLACNKNTEKEIYAFETCATETNNIKHVFDAVRDIITNQNLAQVF